MGCQLNAGRSLMHVNHDAGIVELLVLCGGRSCANCHVNVEPALLGMLPTIGEGDLLDSSEHRDATSRLSWQIVVDEALDGLRVKIASEG